MTYASLLREPGVRRFMVAQGLSFLGSSAMWMASGIWVMQLTKSPGAAGATAFFFLIPAALAPLIGLWIDRIGPRTALIASNLIGASTLLPLFAVHSKADIWLIYVVMLFYGAVNISTAASQSAYLVLSLRHDMLATANGLLRSLQEVLRAISPLAGAGLFARFGGTSVAALDLASFLAAAAIIATTVSLPNHAPVAKGANLKQELTAGIRHLWSTAQLQWMTGASVAFMLAIGFGASVRWAVLQSLGLRPEFMGILQFAIVVGAVPGALISPALVRRLGELRAIALGIAMSAVGLASMGISSTTAVIIGAVVGGLALPVLVVAATTLLQRMTPASLQGRAYAAFELMVTVPQAVSVGAGAALITLVGFKPLLWAATIACIGVAAVTITALRIDPRLRVQIPQEAS